MLSDTQKSTPTALPPASPREPRQRDPRQRDPRLGTWIVATWFGLFLALSQQYAQITELRRQADVASAAARASDDRLSVLAAAEASLATELHGQFDPSSIVRSAEPSVFTLLAGPFQGSAFVLSSDGDGSLLVTNYHVLRSVWTAGVRRVVLRGGGRSFNATVASVWPHADIAVVRVEASLPALETSSAELEPGQPVVVVGSPFGYGGTASTGIVSGVRGRWVQFSAPVSPGSSGGPVLDGDGRVIGVAAAKVVGRGAEGLSFAIPIERVCRLTVAC